MSLVVDASVALKWFVPEVRSEAARALLDREDDLLAPDWLLIEVANCLWKAGRRGSIDPPQSHKILATVEEIFHLLPSAPLVRRAVELAQDLDHPVYDCLYLAAAEEAGAPLVTDDRGLVAAAKTHGLAVVQLGERVP